MQRIVLARLAQRQIPPATAAATRCFATRPTKPSSVPKPRPPNPPPPEPESTTTGPSPTSLSLDFSPAVEEEQVRTGARSSKNSLSSIERRRRIFLRLTMAAFGVASVVGAVYLGRDWTEDELKERRLVCIHVCFHSPCVFTLAATDRRNRTSNACRTSESSLYGYF